MSLATWSPTWAVCLGHPEQARCRLQLEPCLRPESVWLEERENAMPVLWCIRHGASPAPPEVLGWHARQTAKFAEKEKGTDGRD